MSWPRAVLTDSGGYQVFSLPGARTVSEEGATFRSYVDHKTVLLSPESSIATQIAIGGDIMMAFDHCVASTVDLATARAAADLTARWAVRCLKAREAASARGQPLQEAQGQSPQALFGIVQGALFPDLRRECAARLAGMPFDGYAIGGLAVGESRAEREDVCALTAEQMPQEKPRYLMGVGTPLDLLEAVHRGVDMFDCIIPTQVAQRGGAFTSRGYLQMRRTVHAMADLALDPDCDCPTCPRHSRAYLHHLIKVREPLGWQLLGQHNLHFYHRLMREMRESILADAVRGPLPREAGGARRRRPGQPRDPVARANDPGVSGTGGIGGAREGCLRRAHGARGFREHSPRRLGRDHARAHPAHGRGPLAVRRAVGSRASGCAFATARIRRPRSRWSSGTSGSAPRPMRWRRSAATRTPRRAPAVSVRGAGRTPGAPDHQLRDRPRPAPAGAQEPSPLSLPAPRRAGHPARHR